MLKNVLTKIQNALVSVIDNIVKGLRAAQRGIKRFF